MKTNIYRLSYVDQLAAPDFDSGAVENFGLIIYREMLMLYRPGSSSAEEKKERVWWWLMNCLMNCLIR